MNESNPFVVACIPAYNEEKTIGGVVVRAMKHVDKVVVCDDGSGDLTGAIAEGLGAVVVRHDWNRGYGAALQSLFKEALSMGADLIITLDGDGQHDPDDIPKMVDPLKKSGFDIVIGSRFVEGGFCEAPLWRQSGIHLITGMVSKEKLQVTDAQSGLRAYNRRALESLALTENGMGVSTEILVKAEENGLRIGEVPVTIRYDENSSKHNPLAHGIDVVFSTVKHLSINRPLLFYGLPGVCSIAISLFFWVWTMKAFAETRNIITNVAIIAVGSTIVGLMLMTTGIILWVLVSVVREGTRNSLNKSRERLEPS